MDYSQLKVVIWGKTYSAYMYKEVLTVGNFGDEPSEVKISGKSYKVVDAKLDERDDKWNLKLAMASAKTGEKSDGKSTKGK